MVLGWMEKGMGRGGGWITYIVLYTYMEGPQICVQLK